MLPLYQTLRNADPALLTVLTSVWKVGKSEDPAAALADAMLDPDRANAMWESLADAHRQALQTLLGGGGKMPVPMFTRLFGQIRKLGANQIEREKPLQNPAGPAEALYYRGLVATAFEMGNTGGLEVAYVPDDLIAVLPTHRTAYDNLEAETETLAAMDAGAVSEVRPADTSIVDDMTTLLAYCQLSAPELDGETLSEEHREILSEHLLTPGEERMAFLLMLAFSADLLDIHEGRALVRRADARRWLAATRVEQVHGLVVAWGESTLYRELWHIPSLQTPERGGSLDSYDATIARRAVTAMIASMVSPTEWWNLGEFIDTVKETEPDFQRPAGDYDSWYIQDLDGDYLRGFESWNAVEGALITFMVYGPLHWLGLLDVSTGAARLTAYGRAALGLAEWPDVPEPAEAIQIDEGGMLLIGRRVSRIDRFQAARFTTWGEPAEPAAGTPYSYLLDSRGMELAESQGIEPGHINTFLARVLDDGVPPRVQRLLESWQSAEAESATATLETLQVLRTTSQETLDRLLEDPNVRRFTGARLGPTAVVIRTDDAEALRAALLEKGLRLT